MTPRADISGQRFGRLVAVSFHDSLSGNARWLCQCDCGGSTIAVLGNLRRLHTTSCGCAKIDATRARSITHGQSNSPEHIAWMAMRGRCLNTNNERYAAYGGRGIRVCDRWNNSFDAFFEDMGPRPSPKHSIDRIDVNGNYEPGNCRWATQREQCNNRRSNKLITIDGTTKTEAEWCRDLGLSRHQFHSGLAYRQALRQAQSDAAQAGGETSGQRAGAAA